MFGEIANVSVGGMLRLISVYHQTGVLKMKGKDGEGEIYLKDGIIVGTGQPVAKVHEEIIRLLVLKKGYLNFQTLDAIPAKNKQTEVVEVEDLILQASRQVPPEEAAEYLPGEDAVLQLAPVAGDRKWLPLKFQRDEWNLLTQVSGEDGVGALLQKSRQQKGRAIQIIYGLLSAGIIRKTRFKIPKVIEIAGRELGNMGESLVREAMRKLRLDQTRMHMRQLIDLLNELERSITLLLGPSRAQSIIDLMWEGSKR